MSLADLDRAESGQPGEEGGSVVGVDQIEGAFRDTNAEELGASHETVVALAELVREIDTSLTEAVGAGSAASLDALTAELSGRNFDPQRNPRAASPIDSPVRERNAEVMELSSDIATQPAVALRAPRLQTSCAITDPAADCVEDTCLR